LTSSSDWRKYTKHQWI